MNNQIIYPRSPRETMNGWMHLPRYLDKVRLHLAGQLHTDYQGNFGQGFDGRWLAAAGLTHEQFIDVVKNTVTDGEVCDWVRLNVPKSDAEKAAHAEGMANYPKPGDIALEERLAQRKAAAGLSDRTDLKCFVDFIDADEKRK